MARRRAPTRTATYDPTNDRAEGATILIRARSFYFFPGALDVG